MTTLASGWPTETDIGYRADVTLTSTGGVYTSASGINVSDILTRAYWHVAEYCHRGVHGTTRLGFDEAAVSDETHDGGTIIVVKHPPIVSVSSLSWDDTALSESNDDFYVYSTYVEIATSAEAALVQRDPYGTNPWPRYVKVSYTGGFTDTAGTHVAIPHELKEIVLEVATRWLMRAEQQYRVAKGVQEYAIGEVRIKYGKDSDLLADVYERLDALPRTINLRAL